MAVKTCPKCSEDNSPTAIVCISCGTPLYKCEVKDAAQTEGHKQECGTKCAKKKIIISSVLILLVICAVIIICATR